MCIASKHLSLCCCNFHLQHGTQLQFGRNVSRFKDIGVDLSKPVSHPLSTMYMMLYHKSIVACTAGIVAVDNFSNLSDMNGHSVSQFVECPVYTSVHTVRLAIILLKFLLLFYSLIL